MISPTRRSFCKWALLPLAASGAMPLAFSNAGQAPPMDMLKLMTIIRKSGFRGNIPIETLPLQRPDYDPFVEVPKVLREVREAIKATASIQPDRDE